MELTQEELAIRILAGTPVCRTCGRPAEVSLTSQRARTRFAICGTLTYRNGWCEIAEDLNAGGKPAKHWLAEQR